MKNSCGIYLDNNCSNFIVRNNVVWNVSEAGIVINTNSIDNQIYRNTVFDCGEGIQGWPKTEGYSQKGMVIGKGGTTLKRVGKEARINIEKFVRQKVFVELFVKVVPSWSKEKESLKKMGYNFED